MSVDQKCKLCGGSLSQAPRGRHRDRHAGCADAHKFVSAAVRAIQSDVEANKVKANKALTTMLRESN